MKKWMTLLALLCAGTLGAKTITVYEGEDSSVIADYNDLDDAVYFADYGDTIKFLSDVALYDNDLMNEYRELIYDFNGYTHKFGVHNEGAKLTLQGGGTIKSFIRHWSGSMVINDVKVDSTEYSTSINGVLLRGGTCTVNDGAEIIVDNNDDAAINAEGDSELIINGGIIRGRDRGIDITENAKVVIKGGTIEATTDSMPYAVWFFSLAEYNCSLEIKGGTFKGYLKDLPDGCITGGTFDREPDAAYIAEGYAANENGDGTWTVKVLVPNVEIVGGTQYQTFAAAIAEAPENTETTIKLLADLTEIAEIPSGKNIVFDLNGKTLTGKIRNYGTVSVIGGGTVTAASGKVAVSNYGAMTIQSTTFTSDTTATVLLQSGSSCTVKGGTHISGGKQGIQNAGASLTVEDGHIQGSEKGIYYYGTPSITITGGTIQGSSYSIDGKDEPKVSISGGTFKGWLWSGLPDGCVSGGTFSYNLEAKFIAEGYRSRTQGTDPETWKVFQIVYYKLTVDTDRLGSTTKVENLTDMDGNITISKPTVGEGETFVGWYVGNELKREDSLTFTLTEDLTIKAIILPSALVTGIGTKAADDALDVAVKNELALGNVAFKIESTDDTQKSVITLALEVKASEDLKEWNTLTNIETKVEVETGSKGFYKFTVPPPVSE